MTARPPHFECGASTNSATRPYIQLYYYTLLSGVVTSLKSDFKSFAGIIAFKLIEQIYCMALSSSSQAFLGFETVCVFRMSIYLFAIA